MGDRSKPTTYEDFLKSKLAPPPAAGFAAEPTAAPFEWQRPVIKWAWRRGRGALFEDCGLGKTLQQIEWAHGVVRHTNLPVLIFAPLGVTYQTAAEGDKFDLPVTRVYDQAGVSGSAVYITNYQRLGKFDPSAFGGVVLDESSILKDIAGKTRAALTEAFAGTEYRLACTATPSPNDLAELGNHAEFLGVCTSAEMLARFFINDQSNGSTKWRLKGHAEQAFYDWLATWCIYIRSPAALGFDDSRYQLPEHREIIHEVPHDWQEDGVLFKVDARSLADLRAVRRNSIGERLEAMQAIPESGAMVTWCGLNDESAALAAAYPSAVEIAGRHSDEQKEEALMAFARGELEHLITKASIAGHGMNFQAAHQQNLFGLGHSYETYYQRTRRLWRFGQELPVETHIIISDVAAHVFQTIKDKEAVANRMAAELESRMEEAMTAQMHDTGVGQLPEPPQAVKRGDGWTFYHGDSVHVIKGIETDSVGYQVMSTPFPEVYTYSDSPYDFGNCTTEEFSEQMKFLAPEMLRVSMPGRICTLHCMDLPILKQRAGYAALDDFPGELIRIMKAAGWRYFARRMIWKDPVIENARVHSLGHGNLLKDSAKSRVGLPDYLISFKKPGTNPRPVEHTAAEFPVRQWQLWASPAVTLEELTPEERATVLDPPEWMRAPVWYDIAQGDTLQKTSARAEKDEKHICPLQLTAIDRCIEMYSAPGDLVASWFAGIGSEGFVAVKKDRRALLVELKESYWRQGVRNLQQAEQFRDQLHLPLDVS